MADDNAAEPVVMGLRVPPMFYAMEKSPQLYEDIYHFVDKLGDTSDPNGLWYIADNMMIYAHTRGFLYEQRLVQAVLDARAEERQLVLSWRAHTLCWAAQQCSHLGGDYVECGTYEGYLMEVVMHYMRGLPDHRMYLYDLFDPQAGPGVGMRLPQHSPELYEKVKTRFSRWNNVTVTRGKVPDVLEEIAPEKIAFLHLDMNNAEAEIGALEKLFERILPGGMIILDDYGWLAYRRQKMAEDIFFERHGLMVLELPTGQGLAIKR